MSFLSIIIDAIFPLKCISCEKILTNEKHLCADCNAMINWLKGQLSNARAMAAYDGVWANIIHNYKYNKATYLAGPLGFLMADMVDYEYDLIIPVPLHPKRLRERGYNQSALLAKRLAGLTGFRCDLLSLKRIKPTVDQVGLSKSERLENVKGAFESNTGLGDVLLIDDVMTTGATVNECIKVLKKAGAARVDVLTLARTV